MGKTKYTRLAFWFGWPRGRHVGWGFKRLAWTGKRPDWTIEWMLHLGPITIVWYYRDPLNLLVERATKS